MMIYSAERFDPLSKEEKWPFRKAAAPFSEEEQAMWDEIGRMREKLNRLPATPERSLLAEALTVAEMDVENLCWKRIFPNSPNILEYLIQRHPKESYVHYLRTTALEHPIFQDDEQKELS